MSIFTKTLIYKGIVNDKNDTLNAYNLHFAHSGSKSLNNIQTSFYMVICLRTTVILRDELYRKLVNEAIERYGTTKKLSQLLNELLSKYFAGKDVPKSMFGSLEKMDLSDLRDKREPHESN